MMRQDQSRERESLTRVEVNALRTSDDFKQMINGLQGEFGSRLELRMTELVNRLLLE
jgi:hypothetical protein